MRLTDQATMFGAHVHYGCLPGFELHGNNHSLQCSVQGYWQGEMPICKGNKPLLLASLEPEMTHDPIGRDSLVTD
jgi:hypothetical protein